MTDYFQFKEVQPWNTEEGLLREGFVFAKNALTVDVIYSRDPVKNADIQKKHSLIHVYSRIVGLEIQHAVICNHQMEESMLHLDNDVISTLHTLSFSRDICEQFGCEVFFTKNSQIKRLNVDGMFPLQVYDSRLYDDTRVIDAIMNMELDELWISFDMVNLKDFHLDCLRRCKAKSLRIVNAAFCRLSNVMHKHELVSLRNLSSIMFESEYTPPFLYSEEEFEGIVSIRSPQLEGVYIFESGKDESMITAFHYKTLSLKLHDILLDVSIALSNLDFGVYAIYYIVELLPTLRGHNRFKVMETLHRIRESIAKVKERNEKPFKIKI